MARGTDIRGICWYPITAYPGWDNSRHAETGLFSTVVANGTRHVDERLLAEFEEQRGKFAKLTEGRPRTRPRSRCRRTAIDDRNRSRFVGRRPYPRPAIMPFERSINRIRRLLISSSCFWRGRFTSIA